MRKQQVKIRGRVEADKVRLVPRYCGGERMWANRLIPVGHPEGTVSSCSVDGRVLGLRSVHSHTRTHTSLSPPSPWSVISDPVRPGGRGVGHNHVEFQNRNGPDR